MQHPIKPKPLKNTGTNCYLNSTLQAISACDKFMEDVESLYKVYGTDLDALATFYKLICILNDVNRKAIEISHNNIFQHWNKLGQQDCFELLSYILNQVYNQIKAYKIANKDINIRNLEEWVCIPLPMKIIIDYEMRCNCGEVIKLPLQSDFALHITVPIKQSIDLQSAINNFFKSELIKDVECNRKNCLKQEVVKYTKLYFVPDTICIHLQKSHWNGSKLVKIKKKIHFVKDLRIYSEFLSNNNDNVDSFNSKTNRDIILRYKTSKPFENCRYAFLPTSSMPDGLQRIQSAKFENESHVSDDLTNENYLNENCKNLEFLDNSTNNFEKDHIESLSVSDLSRDINKYERNDQKILNNLTIESNIPFSNMNQKTNNPFLENNKSSEKFDFILKSVIVHKGSINKGHYVCYKSINNQWFLANDSKITKVKDAEVYNSDAYVLFYEKV